MGYTPENNPYIPGDPYSYDLAWMVEEVKKAQAIQGAAEDARDIAIAKAAEAETSALDSEAWAVGTKAGDPVTSDDPQYENNSKYYADEAASSASDAADSADHADQVASSVEPILTAQNTAIAVLQARMDTFTNLAEGSTTGDAELIDARIGADGTVYANAGDAIRGQVSDLGNIISPIMITGYASYKTDGQVNANALYDVSPLIKVYSGTQIHLHNVSEGGSIGTCWYDAQRVFISAVSASGIGIDELLTVPAGAEYIRFISQTGVQPTMRYKDIYETFIKPSYIAAEAAEKGAKAFMFMLADKADLTIDDYAIDSTTGSRLYDVAWKRTGFIDVLNYDELFVTLPAFQSSNVGGIAFYDNNLTYISGIAGHVSGTQAVSWIKEYISVPAGAKYASFCIRKADANYFEVIGGRFADKTKKIAVSNYGMQLFEKIGVISDSISVGWAKDRNGNNSRRNVKISWVQQMARRLGATAYNLGASGVDPITWFDPAFDGAAYCYSQYLTAPECDLYIIGLGLNGGTLGSIADIDASDYENNAATFYGQYARIIQMINDQHPNATVICLTQPTAAISAYDTAVRNICGLGYINAVLVDLERYYYDLFNSPEILAERQPDLVHFTPYGYSLIAEAMIIAISDYIANNPAQFKYVGVTDI